MEINLDWREDCPHCLGSGKCSGYSYGRNLDYKCSFGCIPQFSYKIKKGVRVPYKFNNEYIFCQKCNGSGFILTELGYNFRYFLDNYYMKFIEELIENKIKKDKDEQLQN